MTGNIPIITIDGPSGTGKGTLSLLVAEKLRWHLLDSGCLYRILAYQAVNTSCDLEDEATLSALADNLKVTFKLENGVNLIFLDEKEVTTSIKTEHVGNNASKIAGLAKVRDALNKRFRSFLQAPGLVADGRDMGTTVFKEAQLKIYLDASQAERAQRRYNQLKDKGINVSLPDIYKEVAGRDLRDKGRSVSPLRPASDAIIIDTTGTSIEAVLKKILFEVQRVFNCP